MPEPEEKNIPAVTENVNTEIKEPKDFTEGIKKVFTNNEKVTQKNISSTQTEDPSKIKKISRTESYDSIQNYFNTVKSTEYQKNYSKAFVGGMFGTSRAKTYRELYNEQNGWDIALKTVAGFGLNLITGFVDGIVGNKIFYDLLAHGKMQAESGMQLWTRTLKEYAQDNYRIYTNPSDPHSVFNVEYMANMTQSMAYTLGLMSEGVLETVALTAATGGGATATSLAKMATTIPKAVKTFSSTARIARMITKATRKINAATSYIGGAKQGFVEASLNAYETSHQVYKELKGKGFSEKEARRISSIAGNNSFSLEVVPLMILNSLQFGLILGKAIKGGTVGGFSGAVDMLGKGVVKNIKNKGLAVSTKLGLSSLSQIAEENIQTVASKVGQHNTLVKEKIKGEDSLGNIVFDGSYEIRDGAILGGIMGLLFAGMGNATTKLMGQINFKNEKINAIKSKNKVLGELVNIVKRKSNNDNKFNQDTADEINAEIILYNLKEGTDIDFVESYEDLLEKLENNDFEGLSETFKDLDEEGINGAKEYISNVLDTYKEIKQIQTIVNENEKYKDLDDELKLKVVKYEFLYGLKNKSYDNISGEIEVLLNEIPEFTSLNNDEKIYSKLLLKQEVLKPIKSDLSKREFDIFKILKERLGEEKTKEISEIFGAGVKRDDLMTKIKKQIEYSNEKTTIKNEIIKLNKEAFTAKEVIEKEAIDSLKEELMSGNDTYKMKQLYEKIIELDPNLPESEKKAISQRIDEVQQLKDKETKKVAEETIDEAKDKKPVVTDKTTKKDSAKRKWENRANEIKNKISNDISQLYSFFKNTLLGVEVLSTELKEKLNSLIEQISVTKTNKEKRKLIRQYSAALNGEGIPISFDVFILSVNGVKSLNKDSFNKLKELWDSTEFNGKQDSKINSFEKLSTIFGFVETIKENEAYIQELNDSGPEVKFANTFLSNLKISKKPVADKEKNLFEDKYGNFYNYVVMSLKGEALTEEKFNELKDNWVKNVKTIPIERFEYIKKKIEVNNVFDTDLALQLKIDKLKSISNIVTDTVEYGKKVKLKNLIKKRIKKNAKKLQDLISEYIDAKNSLEEEISDGKLFEALLNDLSIISGNKIDRNFFDTFMQLWDGMKSDISHKGVKFNLPTFENKRQVSDKNTTESNDNRVHQLDSNAITFVNVTDKKILSHKITGYNHLKLLESDAVGKEFTIKVIEEEDYGKAEVFLYTRLPNGKTQRKIVSFSSWLKSEKVEKGSKRFKEKIPMAAIDVEGNKVFFIHDVEWFRNPTISATTIAEAEMFEKQMEESIKNIQAIRDNVHSNKDVKVKIASRSIGSFDTMSNKNKTPIYENNPNSVVGVYSKNKFHFQNGEVMDMNDIVILNKKTSLREGYIYEIRRGIDANSFYILYTTRNNISNESKTSITQAINIFHSQETNNNVIKKIKNSWGIDISTEKGIIEYIKAFTSISIAKSLNAFTSEVKNDITKKEGVYLVLNEADNTIYLVEKDSDGAVKAEKFYDITEEQILLQNVSLNKNIKNVIHIDKNNNTFDGDSYNIFVKKNLSTDVISYKDPRDSNNYFTSVNPEITISVLNEENKKTSSEIPEEIENNTESQEEINEKTVIEPKKKNVITTGIVSEELHNFFEDIIITNSNDSTTSTKVSNENNIFKFQEAYRIISNIIAINKTSRPEFNNMIGILSTVSSQYPWMQKFIEKIKNADSKIQNEFVSVFYKNITKQFVIKTDKNNDSFIDILKSERDKVIRNKWEMGLLTSDLIAINKDGYFINKEVAGELKKEFEVIIEGMTKGNDMLTELSKWLSKFGIVISKDTLEYLKEKGLPQSNGYQITDNDSRIDFNSLFFGKGLFKTLYLRLSLLSSMDNANINNSLHHPFGDSRKQLGYLNSLEGRISKPTMLNNSVVFHNNKAINLVQPIKYLTEAFKDVGNKIDNAVAIPFNSTSQLLNFLNKNREFIGGIELFILSNEPIQEYNKSAREVTSFRENLGVSLSAYTNNGIPLKETIGNRKFDLTWRMMSLGTMGDNTQKYFMRVPAIGLKQDHLIFNKKGNVTDFSEDLNDYLYNEIILPEIKRMLDFHKNPNKKYSKNYRDSAHLFHFIPELNKELVYDGQYLVDYLSGVQESDTEEWFTKNFKEQIMNFLSYSIEKEADVIHSIARENSNLIGKDFLHNLKANSFNGKGSNDFLLKMASLEFVINFKLAYSFYFKTFIGDPANFAVSENPVSNFSNAIKRMSGVTAPGRPMAKSELNKYDVLEIEDEIGIADGIEDIVGLFYGDKGKKEAIEILNGNGDIQGKLANKFPKIKAYIYTNKTDGQSYISALSYLGDMFKLGKISKSKYKRLRAKIKNQIKSLREGVPIANKDLITENDGIIFMVEKPVHFGENNTTTGNFTMEYIKTSVFPLLPQFIQGTKLSELLLLIDNIETKNKRKLFVTNSSAIKLGGDSIPFKLSDGVKAAEEKINELNEVDYLIQHDIKDKQEKTITLGTQLLKLITSNIDDIDGFSYDGKDMNGRELKRIIFDNFIKLIDGKLALYNDSHGFNKNGEIENFTKLKEKIKDFLEKNIVASGNGIDNSTKYLTLSEKENETFENLIHFYGNFNIIESKLLAFFDKNFVKHSFQGNRLTLVSENNFDIGNNSQIIFTEHFDVKHGKLKQGQAFIPFDFFDKDGNNISLIDKETGEINEKYVKKDGNKYILTNVDTELLKRIMFRIPTGDHRSMASFEIAGFIPPVMGNIMITSNEKIQQMGVDFDGDVLNVYSYHTIEGTDGKIHMDNKEGVILHANNVIKGWNAILSNKNPEMRKMIEAPLTIEYFTEQARLVEANDSPTSLLSVIDHASAYQSNRVGKHAIGIFSNLSNFHSIIRQIEKNVSIVETITDADGNSKEQKVVLSIGDSYFDGDIGSKSNIKKNRRINDIFGELQSLSTDNAKHGLLSKLNINDGNISEIAIMYLMGFDETSLDNNKKVSIPILFAAQKIIQRYSELKMENKLSIINLLEELRKEFNLKDGENDIKLTGQVLFDNIEENSREVNQAIFNAFSKIVRINEIAMPLVNHFSSITQGIGNNIFAPESRLKHVDKAIAGKDGLRFKNIKGIFYDNHLTSLFLSANKMAMEIASLMFPYGNAKVREKINSMVMDDLNFNLEVSHKKTIYDAIMDAVYSSFETSDVDRERYFIKDNNDPSLPEYLELHLRKGNEIFKNNKFINSLTFFLKGWNGDPVYMGFSDEYIFETDAQALIEEAFIDLFSTNDIQQLPEFKGDKNYNTEKLKNDLIKYSLLQVGKRKKGGLLNFIPPSAFSGLNYWFPDIKKNNGIDFSGEHEWVQSLLNDNGIESIINLKNDNNFEATNLERQIFQHNPKLAKRISITKIGEFKNVKRDRFGVLSFTDDSIENRFITIEPYKKHMYKGGIQSLLFERDKDGVYRRLNLLGAKGLSEYNPNKDFVTSIFNKISNVLPTEVSTPKNELLNLEQELNILSEFVKNDSVKELLSIFEGSTAIKDIQLSIENTKEGVLGYYSAKENKIVINRDFYLKGDKTQIANVLYHELVHAFTTKYIDTYLETDGTLKKDAPKEMKALYDIYIKAKNFFKKDRADEKSLNSYENTQYGFKNIYEFIAEVLTNPTFQNELKTERVSLYNNFIQAIKNIFNSIFGTESIKENAIEASFDLLSVAKENTGKTDKDIILKKEGIPLNNFGITDTKSSVSGVLKKIINSGVYNDNQGKQAITKLLLKHTRGMNDISISSGIIEDSGMFDSLKKDIIINKKYTEWHDSKTLADLVLHEATHSVTANFIESQLKADGTLKNNASKEARNIYSLYLEAKEYFDNVKTNEFEIKYSFKNIHEFMAQVLSSDKLQIALSKIKTKTNTDISLFTRFVTFIRNILLKSFGVFEKDSITYNSILATVKIMEMKSDNIHKKNSKKYYKRSSEGSNLSPFQTKLLENVDKAISNVETEVRKENITTEDKNALSKELVELNKLKIEFSKELKDILVGDMAQAHVILNMLINRIETSIKKNTIDSVSEAREYSTMLIKLGDIDSEKSHILFNDDELIDADTGEIKEKVKFFFYHYKQIGNKLLRNSKEALNSVGKEYLEEVFSGNENPSMKDLNYFYSYIFSPTVNPLGGESGHIGQIFYKVFLKHLSKARLFSIGIKEKMDGSRNNILNALNKENLSQKDFYEVNSAGQMTGNIVREFSTSFYDNINAFINTIGYSLSYADDVKAIRNEADLVRFELIKEIINNKEFAWVKETSPQNTEAIDSYSIELKSKLGDKIYNDIVKKAEKALRIYKSRLDAHKMDDSKSMFVEKYSPLSSHKIFNGDLKSKKKHLFNYNLFIPKNNRDFNKVFEKINNNPVLSSFYSVIQEVIERIQTILPSEQADLYNSFELSPVPMSDLKKILSSLSKPNKVSKTISNMVLGAMTESKEIKGRVNPLTGKNEISINSSNIQSIQERINTLVKIANKEVDAILTKDPQAKVLTNESNDSNSIQVDISLSKGLVNLLAKYLQVEPTLDAVKKSLNINSNILDIKNVLFNSLKSEYLKESSLNIVHNIEFIADSLSLYEGRANAKNEIFNMFESFKKVKDLNGRVRKNAIGSMESWIASMVLGYNNIDKINPQVIVKILDKNNVSSTLYNQSKKYHNSYDKEKLKNINALIKDLKENIDRLKDSDKENDVTTLNSYMKLLEETLELKNNIGKPITIGSFIDGILTFLRLKNLGWNILSAIRNFSYALFDNLITASSSTYFTEDNIYKTAPIIWKYLLNVFSFNTIKSDSNIKFETLMSKLDILQDSSNILQRAERIGSSYGHPFAPHRTAEFAAQGQLMLAMAMDIKLKDKNGKESNLWEALDNDANLKEEFKTEQNIKNFGDISKEGFLNFKFSVDTAIENTHGNYNPHKPIRAIKTITGKVILMFKRFMLRLTYQRFAEYQKDISIRHGEFKGRYRSHTPISAGLQGSLIGLLGLGLAGFGGVGLVAGGAIGYFVGGKNGVQSGIGVLQELLFHTTEILKNIIKLPINVLAGRGVIKSASMEKFAKMSDLDKRNLRANLSEISLTLVWMGFMLLTKSLLWDEDDEMDDDRRKAHNFFSNFFMEMGSETTVYLNPVEMTNMVTNLALLRHLTQLKNMLVSASKFIHNEDIIPTGINAGESSLYNSMKDVFLPNVIANDLFIGKSGEQEFRDFQLQYIFDSPESKYKSMIRTLKLKVSDEWIDEDASKTIKEQQQKKINNIFRKPKYRSYELHYIQLQNKFD